MVLAPLFDIWDAMTLLSAPAHVAILATATIAYGTSVSRSLARRCGRFAWRELVKALAPLALLVAFYATGALMMRPMASLQVDDPDLVVVDFHSHTEASHDGRRGFSVERNREWHHQAGYNVAYVTDHGTLGNVPSALAGNPNLAGDGTVLLPGFEARYAGQHVNVLGFAAESAYRGLPLSDLVSLSRRSRPVGVLTIPANIQAVFSSGPTNGVFIGVEVVDGSPRGLDFGVRQREALKDLAARIRAPLVVGSNNHGWGGAAPAWTVIRIPGWRRLTPRMLDSVILEALEDRENGRVTAVERVPPAPAAGQVFVAEVARLTRNPFRTLSRSEQLAWVGWAWLAWLIPSRLRPSELGTWLGSVITR